MSLELTNISKTFHVSSSLLMGKKKEIRALQSISFKVNEGESLGIVGESGSGKTTLAKILAGFEKADEGQALFYGKDILNLGRKEKAAVVQMVFQDPYASLNPKLILRSQLEEALSESASIEDLMNDVGLSSEFLQRYPHQLSGGQRQRFAIARALAKTPSLLIADEPVSSLDLSVQAQIINLLNDLKKKKKFTLVMISHDLPVVAHLTDHTIVLKSGKIVEGGTTKKVLQHPSEEYTQRLLAATPLL